SGNEAAAPARAGRRRGEAAKGLAPEPPPRARQGGGGAGAELLVEIADDEIAPLGVQSPGQEAERESRRLGHVSAQADSLNHIVGDIHAGLDGGGPARVAGEMPAWPADRSSPPASGRAPGAIDGAVRAVDRGARDPSRQR